MVTTTACDCNFCRMNRLLRRIESEGMDYTIVDGPTGTVVYKHRRDEREVVEAKVAHNAVHRDKRQQHSLMKFFAGLFTSQPTKCESP